MTQTAFCSRHALSAKALRLWVRLLDFVWPPPIKMLTPGRTSGERAKAFSGSSKMDLAIPVGELNNLLAFRVRKTWTSEESLALLVDARQSGMSLDRYVKMNGLTSSMLYRWRSLKYECVSLHTFETGFELRAGLAGWIAHYNGQRPHSALAGRTPDEAYHDGATPSGLGLAPDQMANSNSVRMAA